MSASEVTKVVVIQIGVEVPESVEWECRDADGSVWMTDAEPRLPSAENAAGWDLGDCQIARFVGSGMPPVEWRTTRRRLNAAAAISLADAIARYARRIPEGLDRIRATAELFERMRGGTEAAAVFIAEQSFGKTWGMPIARQVREGTFDMAIFREYGLVAS